MELESAVPAHLRRFVVRQDYSQYTEEDQAVWRFVVLQTHARLLQTAHETYGRGFLAAGISVDRIPKIEEMSERLERFGWRAVCVDGFIPPRAFQAFQARGFLPIATDIRTPRHLTYTPAPDVIHEAAGHAPFLAEPHYARYIRRIGEVARRAFATPADRDVYEAIFALSEIKESPGSTDGQIARAEQEVIAASRRVTVASESAKIARLYWWTAEYGLVGTPSDYRLYGAGLLSSIGEGYFCRLPSVRKIPLTKACIDFDYDVTRAQPQLFVARSLGYLEEVLEDVASTLSYRVGGRYALEMAKASEELATVELDSGAQVIGVVSRIHEHEGQPSLIELTGPVAVAQGGALLDAMPRLRGYMLPLGALEDGVPLSALSIDALVGRADGGGKIELSLASGLTICGKIHALVPIDGRVAVVLLADFELRGRDQALLIREPLYPLSLGERAQTAFAGAPDGFFPPTELSASTVPKPRSFGAAEREMIGLYERAIVACRTLGGPEVGAEFERIVARLDEAFPEDWLLRWNLLESLVKVGEQGELAGRLESSLEQLEIRFEHLEPIATGLSYIRSLVGYRGPDHRAFAG